MIGKRLYVIVGLLACSLQMCAQNSKVENAQPVPPFDRTARLSGERLSFFVLGDWGTGSKQQKHVASAMVAKMQEDGAHAVLSVGDNFYNDGVASTDDPQWQSKFEMMYPRERLDLPFFAVLGNHDYGLNPDAQVAYTGKRLRDGTITRWTMPARYWTKTFAFQSSPHALRIIGLDTQTLIGTDASARARQLRWLDSVLNASNETWRIVIGHHPVFSNGMHGNTLGMIRSVKPLLEKGKVQLYIAGHDHDLQLLEPVAGVHYVISGGGGGSRDVRWAKNTIFAATNLGFAWFEVNAEELLLQFLDGDGNVLYACTIPRETR